MSSNQQLQEFQQKVRIPLYGDELLYTVPQAYSNWIPTIVQNPSGVSDVVLKPRAAITSMLQIFTSASTKPVPMALVPITQLAGIAVVAIFDSPNIKIYSTDGSTATLLGSIATHATLGMHDFIHLSELSIVNVPYLGVTWIKYDKSTSAAYYCPSAAGVLTGAGLAQITDVDFPTQIGSPEILTGPMVQMNGTTYVMSTIGKIYNSDLNSITSWNALGVIQAVAYPDKGVGLCRYKHHIVALGEDSIEFFNDIGNPSPASPLERTEQAFIKFGCASQNLFINIDDTLYWVAQSTGSAKGLWKLQGYTPVKESPNRYEVSINDNALSAYGAARLSVFTSKGTKNLVLNYVQGNSGSGVLCYSLESKAWWSLDLSNLSSFATMLLCAHVGTGTINELCVITSTGLDISAMPDQQYLYQINSVNAFDTKYDATHQYIACSATLNPQDFGNESRKFIRRATFLLDRNTLGTTVNLTFTYQKDARSGSSTVRTLAIADTQFRDYLNNLGACRDVSMVIAIDKPLTLWGMELIVAQGTN